VTVDALHMLLMATLVFLIFRQVMPIAASLAGGMALNSFGFVSRTVGGKAAALGLFAAPTIARTIGKTSGYAYRLANNARGYAGARINAVRQHFRGSTRE
jgi:hypothetical protein